MPAQRPIKSLLVANRSEIAIRVFRAAYELGLRTVAIFTYEDRYSLHRYKADEAYQIGTPDEALKPYLDIEEIIALAKAQNIDAIHPGYGFLSENVQFARRCQEEGLVWVGPKPDTMAALGDKVRAKELAQSLNIPLIESSQQLLDELGTAQQEAERIGYPVMLKAAAGGGGRGMRVVRSSDEMATQFDTARREAKTAFGDDTVFLEKFVERPKHIEVQLLGDQHGNLLHLHERDCSVQRRFQKVVELAPAPNLPQATRDKLYEYSLAIGRAVGYDNAGTVEFLVDRAGGIYFIEVNPRIQVEHTVTEEVTGIDIVRSQILIAQGHSLHGEKIGLPEQAGIQTQGFALQCRVTTEDPAQDFKPDYGRLVHYRHAGGFRIRLDEGSIYPGATVSPFFDSMLVKITASGRSLEGACQRMYRTLSEFRIRGVKTNIPFLQNLVRHPGFQSGEATVNFIAEQPELLHFRPMQDRGTKTLRYLADVIVNGHPDVKKRDPHVVFRTPKVPPFDAYAEPAPGTKQLLTELGPEGFAKWVKEQPELLLTDTTFRDAHQSLLATRVRTHDMLAVAESFAKHHPQFFSMEVWGGATFDVAMRFLHESPWERLRLLRQAIPNICLQMLTRGTNAVGYTAYPDNLIERFIEQAAETGIDIFRIFDALNLVDNMTASITAVRQRTGSVAEACICYTGDILDPNRPKYNLNYYLDLAKRLEDAGAHMLAIKDMAGLLKPLAAQKLVAALKQAVDLPIHLHTHDTAGVQTATYLMAAEAGVDVADVAISSMSGLTSQPNANSVLAMLADTPRAPKVDVHALNSFAQYWEDVRLWYYPFESGLKASTAEVYEHEIPGGQYSNLRPQAESLGLLDRWEDIKRNYRLVNDLLGDIVKVTPSSKVVGDFALFLTTQNLAPEDVLTKGGELSFPASVKGFLKGELGIPEGGFPDGLQAAILGSEKPLEGKPNAHLAPIDFEQDFAAFQAQFGSRYTFEDFLASCLYPKVFEDYVAFIETYGNLSYLPTTLFFFGMKPEEEALIDLESGKSILVRYLHCSEPDERGYRTVYFELNGRSRGVRVLDTAASAQVVSNPKASGDKQVGAPLQGKLSKLLVQAGDQVAKGKPLFVVEAMKMETTVAAPADCRVEAFCLPEGSLVEAGDLVVKLS